MPNNYVQQRNVPILEHFTRFLRLLGDDKAKRDSLIYVYVQELGDPAWEGYTLDQVRDNFEQEPLQFFMLVSALLDDPAQILRFDDRIRIADGLRITLLPDVENLIVTDDGVWLRELVLEPLQSLRVNRYKYRLNSAIATDEIVPISVFDYLKSAAVCYRARLFPAALALAAIAFEACLREVLDGLERNTISLPPPYKPAKAQVDAHLVQRNPALSFKVSGACQDLRGHFLTQTPKGQGFLGNIKFDINRDDSLSGGVGPGSSKKVSLRIDVDPQYVDLLSSDRRETTPRQRKADKFAEFNEAAELAGRLQRRRLPLDSAETIRQVRNYLVHWDERSLEEVLSDGQTVREYISNQSTVRTTLEDVVYFISDEYYDLRQFELAKMQGPAKGAAYV